MHTHVHEQAHSSPCASSSTPWTPLHPGPQPLQLPLQRLLCPQNLWKINICTYVHTYMSHRDCNINKCVCLSLSVSHSVCAFMYGHILMCVCCVHALIMIFAPHMYVNTINAWMYKAFTLTRWWSRGRGRFSVLVPTGFWIERCTQIL